MAQQWCSGFVCTSVHLTCMHAYGQRVLHMQSLAARLLSRGKSLPVLNQCVICRVGIISPCTTKHVPEIFCAAHDKGVKRRAFFTLFLPGTIFAALGSPHVATCPFLAGIVHPLMP